ncbi:MAG: cytochrome C [Acidobacteriaceae bacterium]|nr:cytochrome C [Acidobacteriaceae bacterium]
MRLPALSAPRLLMLTAAVALAAGAGLMASSTVHAQPATADEYTTIVKPILEANCIRCHSEVKHKGGLVLETRAGILKGGAMDGPVIVPGHPEQSLLVKLIRHEGPINDPMPMPPPPRTKLSDADIAAITQWIKNGAVIPQ